MPNAVKPDIASPKSSRVSHQRWNELWAVNRQRSGSFSRRMAVRLYLIIHHTTLTPRLRMDTPPTLQ